MTSDRSFMSSWVDDSGTGTDGTALVKADWTALLDAIDGVDAWASVTFSAGNYTAQAGNWTVAEGDVTTHAYTMLGAHTMLVAFHAATTTVSSTPTYLQIPIPASKTATKSITDTGRINDNGTLVPAICYVTAGQTYIRIERVDGANLTASTDNTGLRIGIEFEV